MLRVCVCVCACLCARLSVHLCIPSLAFVIESINPVDRGALMIPPNHEEVFGILDFIREKQANAFQTLTKHRKHQPAVDRVATSQP